MEGCKTGKEMKPILCVVTLVFSVGKWDLIPHLEDNVEHISKLLQLRKEKVGVFFYQIPNCPRLSATVASLILCYFWVVFYIC